MFIGLFSMHKLILVILILFKVGHSKASCSNLLRLIVKDRLGTIKHNLHGRNTIRMYKYKDQIISSLIHIIGSKDMTLLNKKSQSDNRLNYVLENRLIEAKKIDVLHEMINAANDPHLIMEWIKKLHQDIAVEIYLEGSYAERANYYIYQKTAKNIVLSVLENRLKKAGFIYGIEKINRTLSSEDFSEVLKSKKLILDSIFEFEVHGDLIHILQLDLMVYALKKQGINPSSMLAIYEWMGKNAKISLNESVGTFSPLEDVWGAVFESFNVDYSNPRILNPVLEAYLDIQN